MATETAATPHTLFVRKSCKYSQLIQGTLEEAGLAGDFSIVDVDVTPVNPRQVSVVPTIVADQQHKLSGRDAFAWTTDYITKSPQCMTVSSAGKCTSWDAMSSSFAFIEGQGDSEARTNTAMSAVYSTFPTDSAPRDASSSGAPPEGDALGDAVAKLQNERNDTSTQMRRG